MARRGEARASTQSWIPPWSGSRSARGEVAIEICQYEVRIGTDAAAPDLLRHNPMTEDQMSDRDGPPVRTLNQVVVPLCLVDFLITHEEV